MENALHRFKRIFTVIALLAIATAAPAFAGSGGSLSANEGYIDVTAQVAANCTLAVIAQPPTYQVIPGQPLGEESGTLGVNCTNGTPYIIELGSGEYGADGAAPTRYMCNSTCAPSTAPSNGIEYQIFQDAAETAPWGDSVGGNTIGGTGRGMAASDTIDVPFYVDSPPGQTVSNEVEAGTADYYSDQVLVTVSY
jgi:spore coat protein U-like protein